VIFLFRQPFLHFLLIGILLFALQHYQGLAKTYQVASLDEGATQLLVDDFFSMTARMPAPSDMKKLVAKELDKRILFAEGLRLNFHRDDSVILQRLLRNAIFLGFEGSDKEKIRAAFELGIHESDEVIRARIVQRMASVGRSHATVTPTDAELMDLYQADLSAWQEPARYTFEHLFFSVDREQEPVERAALALEQLQADSSPQGLGDIFLPGTQFSAKSLRDVASIFGVSFSEYFNSKDFLLKVWQGPIASVFGQHIVRVTAIDPVQQQAFNAVRRELAQRWQEEQENAAFEAYLAQLRGRYRVTTDGELQ
jgi:hypothetical protein